MNFKKIIAVIICLSMMTVIFSGCGKKEVETKRQVTLNIKLPPLTVSNHATDITDAYDMLKDAADKFAKQHTDIDLTINVVKFAYIDEDEFITDAFGTEAATDVLFEGYFNMSGYIHTGRVVPLDDIISDELRADFYESYLDMSCINGKTYMLPLYSLENVLGYNKQMLRDCGLEDFIGEPQTIQSWTPEEWDTVLSTLAEKLPDMSFPMMMYGKNDQGDTHIMTLIRSRGCELFSEDGHFQVDTPEGISALQWIKDGYDKGYFPKGCEHMEMLDCNDLFENNQLAIHMVNSSSVFENPDNIGYVNFPSIDGNGMNTAFLTGFMVFDNGDPEKVQLSKEFLKFFYSQDEYMDYCEIAIPALKSVTQRDAQYLNMAEQYAENSKYTVDITDNNPNWRGVRDVFYTHIHDLLSGEKTPEQVAKDIDDSCNKAIDTGWAESKLLEK